MKYTKLTLTSTVILNVFSSRTLSQKTVAELLLNFEQYLNNLPMQTFISGTAQSCRFHFDGNTLTKEELS